MRQWNRLHISDLKRYGIAVFNKLRQRPLVALSRVKYICDQESTFAHIIRYFLAAGKNKVALTSIHSGVEIFNPNDFLTSLVVLYNDPGARC